MKNIIISIIIICNSVAFSYDLVSIVNDYRFRNGKLPLKQNTQLDIATSKMAEIYAYYGVLDWDNIKSSLSDVTLNITGIRTTYISGFSSYERNSNAPQRGEDLRLDIEIDFLEACFGLEKEITIRHLEPCEACIVLKAYLKAHPLDKITSLKPKAKAVLKIVPTFPGSCTSSRYKTRLEVTSFVFLYRQIPTTSVNELF